MCYYFFFLLMCMDMMKLMEQLCFLNSKVDRLYVDIMDGYYVKNLVLLVSFVVQICFYILFFIDVYLMVEVFVLFILVLLDVGVDVFLLYLEIICCEVFWVINMFCQVGKEVGMVFNFVILVESIQYYLYLFDKVMVMIVDSGYVGQLFIFEMFVKIMQFYQFKEIGSFCFLLEVDGFCNCNIYCVLLGVGVQILVMGSSGLFCVDMLFELVWEIMFCELFVVLYFFELVQRSE